MDAVIRALPAWDEARLFLWVHLYDPHDPYTPPAGHAEGYVGEIEYVDHEIGRLLASLRQQRAGRPRVVVFVADHGEGLGEHRERQHGLFVYDSTPETPIPEGK